MHRRTISSLQSNRENANRREQFNKQKTNTEDKKQPSNEESEDNAANTSTSNATVESKVEDDIYEFKSTPKDSSCSSGDDKSDAGKHSDKSSDEKSGTDSDTPNPSTSNLNLPQVKRPFTDVDTPDENASTTDDESKRKKRKDNESVTTKDNIKGLTGNRNLTRQEKNPTKTGNLTNKNLTNLEGKSPTPSPKPVKPEGGDAEIDDSKSTTDDVPKVPPLKIVIPQQNNSGDQEVGGNTKTNKNTSNRSQNALPYVVASSDNSGDKEAASTGSLSPDLTKGLDDKSSKSSDDRAQQRVLRSALRGNAQGNSASDRNSNNSSPQNSASPSPAPASDSNQNSSGNSTVMATTTNTEDNNSGSGGQPVTANSGNSNEEAANTTNQASSTNVSSNQTSTPNQNENTTNSTSNSGQTSTSSVSNNPTTTTTSNNNINSNQLSTPNTSMTPSNSDSNQTTSANQLTAPNSQNTGSNQATTASSTSNSNPQVSNVSNNNNSNNQTVNSGGNIASNNNSVASSNSNENNSSSNNNAAANGSSSSNNSSLSNNDTEPSNNNGTTNSVSNNNNLCPTAVQQQQTTSSDAEIRNTASPANQTNSTASTSIPSVELHPRKRKIRTSKETTVSAPPPPVEEKPDTSNIDLLPAEQPYHNCYQMYLNIRKQIERKHRNLVPITPKPPQGYKDYLMNRRTYVLAGKTPAEPNIIIPTNLPAQMKDLFVTQEKERHKLKTQHIVEKEKLVLSVEQEIVRVHCRAARTLANQSQPFSVATILKDQEVYKVIEPSEQEDKDRNSRGAPKGRLFLSWLQDVDDKWEKIKEAMILRHHNEAESLHAVQKMDWEFKMKEVSLCDYKAKPVIEEQHVPIVNVSDDFDLLPA